MSTKNPKVNIVTPKNVTLIYDVTKILLASDPEPTTELQFKNPYTLLIAVLLSAQTTDKQVNIATAPLFEIAEIPSKVVAMGEGVLEYTKTLNYYKTKTKNVLKASQMLVDMGYDNGEVPQDLKTLISLPGVGEKTAMVMLNVIYDLPYIPVDTHVHRILNRLRILKTDNANATSKLINAIPERDGIKNKIHHTLILHARYVCKALKPLCGECVISSKCKYYHDSQK